MHLHLRIVSWGMLRAGGASSTSQCAACRALSGGLARGNLDGAGVVAPPAHRRQGLQHSVVVHVMPRLRDCHSSCGCGPKRDQTAELPH